MTFRPIGNIAAQLSPDPPVASTCVIGFGLHWPNRDRCHVTVQTPDGEQFHERAMDRGQTLHGDGWSVVWEAGEPYPRVKEQG